MAATTPLLAQLIDDYIAWFVDWHRLAQSCTLSAVSPPARFQQWRNEAIKSLAGEQPAIEHVALLHEQLHTLIKLVLMKAPENAALEKKDDESIAAKYLELMQELRRFERAFATAASSLDPLTGLRTRQSLTQDLEREISRAVRTKRPFFVAIMDIDHFKKINDTHGHEVGDKILASVANHISRGLRGHDDAYRLGGEEFLIVLKETDEAGSLSVLERLRILLEKTPLLLKDGHPLFATASIGLALCDSPTKPDALLRRADEALYRAKNDGRNRIVIDNKW